MADKDDWLQTYLNTVVVIDLDSGHVLIGELLDFSRQHLVFRQADLHDCTQANSSKEVYLAEAYRYGVNINRKAVAIPRNRLLAISRLEDAKRY